MIEDIGLFGACARKNEEEMVNEMEAALKQLKLTYERKKNVIFIPASDAQLSYTLKARPMLNSYELSAALPFNESSCPNTSLWFAELKTKEYSKGNGEVSISYDLKKSVLSCVGKIRSGRNKEQLFLELLGRLDRAIKDDWPDFEALSKGVISETVLQEARENIYPVVKEVEQSLKTNEA